MKINERLKRVASFVDDNSYIIDVGCDHALLDIYLVKNKKNIKALASDINEGPLKYAIKNIEKYNLSDKIKTSLANGISKINSNIDTIIISGMGTSSILDIIFSDKSKLSNIKKIIISSNNNWYLLRKTFMDNGYSILDEDIIKNVLKADFYKQAVKELGKLDYKDIFFFTPALVLGGREELKFIKKGNGAVHHQVLLQIGQEK